MASPAGGAQAPHPAAWPGPWPADPAQTRRLVWFPWSRGAGVTVARWGRRFAGRWFLVLRRTHSPTGGQASPPNARAGGRRSSRLCDGRGPRRQERRLRAWPGLAPALFWKASEEARAFESRGRCRAELLGARCLPAPGRELSPGAHWGAGLGSAGAGGMLRRPGQRAWKGLLTGRDSREAGPPVPCVLKADREVGGAERAPACPVPRGLHGGPCSMGGRLITMARAPALLSPYPCWRLAPAHHPLRPPPLLPADRKSTRLNSSH